MPQVVFLTLFLGLVSGRQSVALQVAGDVHAIRLVLDGIEIAKLNGPPWQTSIDLGAAPQPRELVAIGLDANGAEIARASQTINLPHPTAEVQIVVHENGVSLKATHFTNEKVTSSTLKLDDKPLPLDTKLLTAKLPPDVDMKRPHVIAAELLFADGVIARREIVIGGQFGETLPAQLTPVAIKGTDPSCFGEERAHVTTIEDPDAIVILIRDPDPSSLRAKFLAAYSYSNHLDYRTIGQIGWLGATTVLQPLWPVAQLGKSGVGPVPVMFSFGPLIEPSKGGVLYLMTHLAPNGKQWNGPRRWSDAVAVAGARATDGGHRRAVILILGDADDASINDPVAVRSYLATIGVPLFVWSALGPRPDLAKSWGDVVDISSPKKLEDAAAVVRRTLDAQRIAWLDVDPVTALRSVRDACNAAR